MSRFSASARQIFQWPHKPLPPQLYNSAPSESHQVSIQTTANGGGRVFIDGMEVQGITSLSFRAAPGCRTEITLSLCTRELQFTGPGCVHRTHRPLPDAMPPETFMLEDFYVRRLGETPHARGMAVLYRRVGEDDTVVRRIPKPQWERHAVQVRDYLEAA